MTNANRAKLPERGLITQIGSLPHHNVDAAVSYALRSEVPFLPQIPIRHSREFMVAQALDGLPGLRVSETGQASLNLTDWNAGYPELERRLERAFAQAEED